MTKQEYMAMSLPYGLKIINDGNEIETISALGDSFQFQIRGGSFAYGWYGETFDCKPILRPLSDLIKPIEHKGDKFIPLVELLKNSSFDTSKMSEEEIMSFVEVYSTIDLIALNDLPLYLQWHFDLFGGIESGEAIDVNTLDINPYK